MAGIIGQLSGWRSSIRSKALGMLVALALAAPAAAQQLESFDPDQAYDAPQASDVPGSIDGDLMVSEGQQPAVDSQASPSFEQDFGGVTADPAQQTPEAVDSEVAPATADMGATYGEDDLIGAAEGVFGKGAEGLARMIEDLLEKQGKPNAYIVGREAGGAFIVGARYGSGTLHHKIEGEKKVYWTGPSIGFDAGANAANTFVLVYNLYDTEDLYKRFPAGEGQAYFIGGLHASYLRWGDVVLIPIRMGAGIRLGVNAGYMKFSKKQRWLPF
ncbi:MAG: DUF1134 domain-containing protein [Erythrobacter sp.]|nr:DUF1134 domain-containing protein [Erythrobacter sp.]